MDSNTAVQEARVQVERAQVALERAQSQLANALKPKTRMAMVLTSGNGWRYGERTNFAIDYAKQKLTYNHVMAGGKVGSADSVPLSIKPIITIEEVPA